MGILFISHSSRDDAAAVRVCEWLKQRGWGEIFLDLDPEQGLVAGQRWQQELKQAGERCSGVVVLISPDWLASRWCQTEFLLADQLGKKIFPVLIRPTLFDDLPIELKSKFQIVDVSSPDVEAKGFERLAIGLKRSGLDPRSFPWPPPDEPHRSIYRGLESMDEQDAAIFFGRDALITKALDTLRRMRDGASERVLVVMGASGAGKSSFLKAGLIARLKRDEENFLVLPVVRPERAALTGPNGLAASLGSPAGLLGNPDVLPRIFTQIREPILERLRRIAGGQDRSGGRPPTIIIPVDQAEELFTADNTEASAAIDLLGDVIRSDPDTLILATIRSDSFARLQGQQLAEMPLQPFNLPPIPLGAFKEVIECPARLANPPLAVEPSLIDRLLQDLAAEDALPLLALTLERLSSRQRSGGTLTLAEYADKLGGLRGAIVGAVEAAFSEAQRDPALPQTWAELEKLARAAFIPALVHLDDADAEPRRRVERLSALPEKTHPLVRHLVNQRLLVSNRSVIEGVETDTIEVTHEAILRQWPALRAWIAEERDALRTLDLLHTAAMEWQAHKSSEAASQGQSWLVHRGSRLQEAEALLARSDFAAALGPVERTYLAACRQHENAEILREQHALARTRRLQRNIAFLIAAAAGVVLLAGLGIVQLFAGIAADTANVLAMQAVTEATQGNYDAGARFALAALDTAKWAHQEIETNAESELSGAISESSALSVLQGHDGPVLGASFSRDGRRIVTASRDRTARIWDVATGHTTLVLNGHQAAVHSAAFNLNGRRVVTAAEDGTARVWDAYTGAQLLILRGHEGTVYSAGFSPDATRIVTASADGTARIWDARSGAQLAVLRGHTQPLGSAAFSPDGKRVVTASDDHTARVWDAETGREVTVFRGHEDVVESAVFSPDGQRVATGSDDTTARIWDAYTGRPLQILRNSESAVASVTFNSGGTRLATVSRDGVVRIWDAIVGSEQAELRGHQDVVNSVSFSADSQRLVTGSDDGTARVWDANPRVTVLHGHTDIVNGVAFSRDGMRVATASTDKTARVWDTKTGHQVTLLQGHGDLVEAVAFSPDGKRVVSGSDDRTARIWDTSTGRLLVTLRGSNGAVYGVAFSPDGKRILTASTTDKAARIWNADTGAVLKLLRGHTDAVNSAEFDAEGRRVVTSSKDGTAIVWDALSGRVRLVLRTNSGRVNGAAFSRDGREIVTAGQDNTARLWDSRNGRLLLVLRGHSDSVMSAEFSIDGKRILTASHDRTARIWDAGTGSPIAVLRGHASEIEAAVFSSDGKWAATGSDDFTARIWNISGMIPTTRSDLIQKTCGIALAHGLSRFFPGEIRAAPVLDPRLDTDACDPPGIWARLARIFETGIAD